MRHRKFASSSWRVVRSRDNDFHNCFRGFGYGRELSPKKQAKSETVTLEESICKRNRDKHFVVNLNSCKMN